MVFDGYLYEIDKIFQNEKFGKSLFVFGVRRSLLTRLLKH